MTGTWHILQVKEGAQDTTPNCEILEEIPGGDRKAINRQSALGGGGGAGGVGEGRGGGY